MTQEDKNLLLKDLCARLPYGVMVYFEGWNPEKLSEVNLNEDVYNGMGGMPVPYLRPMSSMTEEERKHFESLCCWGKWEYGPIITLKAADWLNENKFDYRGLIEKGLALEAPEGMYE